MWIRRVVLGGLIASALVLGVAPPSASASVTNVRPDRLTVLSDVFTNLPQLPAPRDGRLRGYGFAATVTGDECAPSVSGEGTTLRPVAGYEVCAFRFEITFFGGILTTDFGQSVPGFSAHVEIGMTRLALTSNVVNSSNDEEFAVAVRSNEDAELVMSAAGYAQSFSLTAGVRTGTSPEVLYRAPGSYEVTASPHTSAVLTETAPTTHTTASVKVTLSGLELSWFMPGDPLVTPPRRDDAFLGLLFSEADLTGPSGARFADFGALPGSAFHLELPDHRAIPGTLVETIATGLVANEYVFSVPAGITTASLTLAPGIRNGYEQSNQHRSSTTAASIGTRLVSVRFGSSTFPVAIPHPFPGSSRSAAAAPGSGRPGGSGPLAKTGVPLLARGAVVVLAASTAGGGSLIVIPLVIVLRRRRTGRRLRVRFPRASPGLPEEQPAEPEERDEGVRVVEPPVRPAVTEAVLALRVMGPLELDGVAAAERRHLLEELCAYLILRSGRDVPADEICTDLGGAKGDWSPGTLYKRVSALRRALGPRVLVKGAKAGYRLVGEVTSDWATFSALVAEKSASEDARVRSLTAALELVRGVPFSGVPPGQYAWAHGRQFSFDMTVAIESAALELTGILLDRGDARKAREAARGGLKGSPYCFALLANLLRAGALEGRTGLEQAWREVHKVAGDDDELHRLKEHLALEIVSP